VGYDYVHTAIDDHSRLAYAEIHDDEKGTTCAGFLTRAAAFYASHGITVDASSATTPGTTESPGTSSRQHSSSASA